jgi:hypothetical protein
MKEPKRWSDPAGGADAETHALLQQAPQVGPSHSEVNRMWAGLAPRLDVAYPPPGPNGSQSQPGLPGHGPQAAAAAGTGALVGKVTLVVVFATAVGAVGVRAISSRDRHGAESSTTKADRRPSLPEASPMPPEPAGRSAAATTLSTGTSRESRLRPERSAHPRSVASAPSPTAVAAQPTIPQERAADTRALVEAAPPAETAPVSVNELLQESRRLDRARTALRAGEPAHALRLLRDGAPETTALAQEREALTIEAQAAIPALRAAAGERARAFLRAYPGSPYRARIKAIVFDGE